MKIYLAPLEGVTGYIYRRNYEMLYGKIDKYFAPFISPAENCPINPKEFRDIDPNNNKGIYLVPQILTAKSEHFISAAEELSKIGFTEINLNLGCPSGTVTSKGKGSGFLSKPDELKLFLDDIYSYGTNKNLKFSIKTRLGFSDPDEFYKILEIYNEFPISELIIHPRYRGDMYKGEPRLEHYKYAIDNSKIPLVYNGNIYSNEDYQRISEELTHKPDTIMIGRGAIANPSLAENLSIGKDDFDKNKFWQFHDMMYTDYKEVMAPDINVLFKMRELWTFWKNFFERFDLDQRFDKCFKQIMKAKKYHEYDSVIQKLRS